MAPSECESDLADVLTKEAVCLIQTAGAFDAGNLDETDVSDVLAAVIEVLTTSMNGLAKFFPPPKKSGQGPSLAKAKPGEWDYDGELHIQYKSGKDDHHDLLEDCTFTFTHGRVSPAIGGAWEALVAAARAIVAQAERGQSAGVP